MKRLLWILGCLLLSRCADLRAQDPPVLLSVNEGLSQGMVYDILQSRDGYIWIATKDGLNRYNGYHFKAFSPDAFDPFSIANGEIRSLYEDSRGWLWLCYINGIDVFDPASGRSFHLPFPAKEGFNGYNISFFEDKSGRMWATFGSGLLKIKNPATAVRRAMQTGEAFPAFEFAIIRTPPTLGQAGVNSVFGTKKHPLLIATTQGVYTLDAAGAQLRPQPIALQGINVKFIGQDREGRLWFHSEKMVCCIREMQPQPDFIKKTARNNNWQFDQEGNIWGREDEKLSQWRPVDLIAGRPPLWTFNFREGAAPSDAFYLTSLLIDRAGNAWVGTGGYGLMKKGTAKPKFQSHQPLVSHRNIYEDPKGHLIAISNAEMVYTDRQFKSGRPNPWFAKLPSSVPLKYMVFDKEGNCWLNVPGQSICRVDAQTKDYQCFDSQSHGIWYTAQGKIMTLTEKGLLEWDAQKKGFIRHTFNQPLSWGYDIGTRYFLGYEGSDGVLWAAAYDGLLMATPSDRGYRFERFLCDPAKRSSLSNNLIISIAEDPQEPRRYLWAGTKGGGLNRLDRQTGQFRHFGPAQGLPDKVIYGILPDGTGNLWLSTNKGLCRFNPRDFSSKNFTAADGIQSNEFNQGSFLKTSDGYLIFGGVNGLTVFHPDSLRFNEIVPQTQIVGVKIDNEPVHPSTLSFSHRQTLLSIEFSALDFSNPSQNQYRYQLIKHGVFRKADQKNWVDIFHNHNVQFVNLRPGHYTFRVMGTNNDGIWSEQPAVLEFVIRPPWWAAWWAYLLYAAALGAALFVFYQTRLRQKMQDQESLRLRELDNFKNRFFTNITHEFRTPLTVILGTNEQLVAGSEQWAAELERPMVKGKLNLIRRNGENLLRLVNQILDLAKLESGTLHLHYVQGDVAAYLRYIVDNLRSAAEMRGVRLQVECPDHPLVMDYDPERLLQIVHNLLSNAIKFTPVGGSVRLRIDLTNFENFSNLLLAVADTGAGIVPEDLPYIFDRFYQTQNLEKAKAGGTGIGLALTKELVNAMGGRISVESEPGAGSVFRVTLPVTQHAEKREIADTPALMAAEPNTGDGTGFLTTWSAEKMNAEQASVLLIEDNPDVQEYLAACLAPYYALDFASNGRIGIEKAIETVPDLIISDVMMPEKDGFEVCERLKNDECTNHIPIVLLTAKVGVENRIAGLRRGADAYLGKPFHEEELLVMLANLLETRKKLQTKYAAQSLIPSPLSSDLEDDFLQKVRAAVWEHLDDRSFNVEALCRLLVMSQPQLHRKLKALTGQNATRFIRSLRLAQAKELLAGSDMNISEVAFAVGFEDPKYFSRVFAEEFGVAPSRLR